MTAIATIVFTSSVYAADGINSSTGYAENYTVTGDEMLLDFDDVSWNVVNVDTESELEDALESLAQVKALSIMAKNEHEEFVAQQLLVDRSILAEQ